MQFQKWSHSLLRCNSCIHALFSIFQVVLIFQQNSQKFSLHSICFTSNLTSLCSGQIKHWVFFSWLRKYLLWQSGLVPHLPIIVKICPSVTEKRNAGKVYSSNNFRAVYNFGSHPIFSLQFTSHSSFLKANSYWKWPALQHRFLRWNAGLAHVFLCLSGE